MVGPCAWSGSAGAFRTFDPAAAGPRLAASVSLLQAALAIHQTASWWVTLDVRLLRLGRRIDMVVATDRAVLAILSRPGLRRVTPADRREAEDAALDLADFHAGSAGVPIVPVVLIPDGGLVRHQRSLPLAGAASVAEASRLTLPLLLREVASFPSLGRSGSAWAEAAYAPVAGLMEAACSLYAQHGVAALRLAASGPDALRRTQAALADVVRSAQAEGSRVVAFVTGAPGAGKTLCGLDLAFTPGAGAALLTANPTLVHVLREALVRDASARSTDRRAATRQMDALVQALPQFRDALVASGAAAPERLVVIDEAQRCWTAAHAIGKTRNRAVPLRDSEPGHLLDIMARRPGWAVLVCLVGGGQEIHDGEGGLAGWSAALQARPEWRAVAPEPVGDRATLVPALHLATPVRANRAPSSAEWVRAVLADEPDRAAAIGPVPFRLTRSLEALRRAVAPRGTRSSGLLASSTARRLRAEGLGAVLPHQDEDAVARWFLDRWPDIRSSDALEVVATEFAVQGLELDRAGLCWDADLVRGPAGWVARRFRGTRWTGASAQARASRLNAYRVLLTRARHGTVLWVPRGDSRDETRDPTLYDGIAEYLLRCGAKWLDDAQAGPEDASPPEARLL